MMANDDAVVERYVRSLQGQECEVAVQAEDWFSWVVGV